VTTDAPSFSQQNSSCVAIATPHSTGLWIVPTNDTKVSTKPTCKFTDHVAHRLPILFKIEVNPVPSSVRF
jgi:hypothetical protein